MTTKNVAFIGLGAMGLHMARNIVKGGHRVTGFDLSASACEAFATSGAKIADSAAQAAADADIVITMLPRAQHIRAALTGDQGVLKTLSKQAVFINMSTVLPQETDELAALLAQNGIAMVDAPVGRSAMEAERGALLILASGTQAAKDAVREVLLCMGNEIIDCGEVGGGSRVKVVNNFMGISLNALTAEALTLAEASGLSIELALQVMRGTIAGMGHMNITYPNKVLRGDLSPGFVVIWRTRIWGWLWRWPRATTLACPWGQRRISRIQRLAPTAAAVRTTARSIRICARWRVCRKPSLTSNAAS